MQHIFHNGNIMKKNIYPNNTNKIMKIYIFSRPEETMLGTGKWLSHNKNIFCSERNLDLVQPKIMVWSCFAITVCINFVLYDCDTNGFRSFGMVSIQECCGM